MIKVDSPQLEKLLLRPVETGPSGTPHGYLILGQIVPNSLIHLSHPKICPECLSRHGYVNRIWDIRPFTVCPYHKRLLVDSCPACKRKIMHNRAKMSICICGFDWRESPYLEIDDREIALSVQMLRLCGMTATEFPRTIRDNSNPLNDLNLEHMLPALFFMAEQYYGILDNRGKKTVRSCNNQELHDEVIRGYDVFCNWPNNYFRLLSQLRMQNWDRKREVGVRKDYRYFHSAIYVGFRDRQYDFLREGFEEHQRKHRNVYK